MTTLKDLLDLQYFLITQNYDFTISNCFMHLRVKICCDIRERDLKELCNKYEADFEQGCILIEFHYGDLKDFNFMIRKNG